MLSFFVTSQLGSSSNPPISHKLPQHGVDARLPARTAAAQMFHGSGIKPDFHFDLRRVQLGTSAPGWLHSSHKGRIQRRIVFVDIHPIYVHPLNRKCKREWTLAGGDAFGSARIDCVSTVLDTNGQGKRLSSKGIIIPATKPALLLDYWLFRRHWHHFACRPLIDSAHLPKFERFD